MKLFRGIDSFENIGPVSVTVGSFDGVHAGHRSLISSLTASALSKGNRSLVVSFSPHPRVALGRTEGFSLLSSEQERAELIAQAGVDAMLLIDFDLAFSQLSFEQFVESYLIKGVGMRELVVGYDHRLGHNAGGFDSISALASSLDFKATLAREFSIGDEHISSTVIRDMIASGDMESAMRLLGRPYLFIGEEVSSGVLRSHEPLKLLPPKGEYIALVNGVECRVAVDEGCVLCTDVGGGVKIEFLKQI